jgi:hypothetical protein
LGERQGKEEKKDRECGSGTILEGSMEMKG